MPNSTLAYTWEEVEREGREYCLELNVSVDWSPIIPAKIHGPPEDCYPAEGGDIEVTEIELQKVTEILPTGERLEWLEDVQEPGSQKLWEERFAQDVQETDAFRDWLIDEINDVEAWRNEPDDRRDELRERYL